MAKLMNLSKLVFAGVAAVNFADHGVAVNFADHGVAVNFADHGVAVNFADHGVAANFSLIRQSQDDFTAKKRVREPDLCRFYLN
jgi:hypothetical protein